MIPDYLILGHITRDLLPDSATAPGGTALYAAMTAHRLGCRAAIVSAQADLPPNWPESIEVTFYPAPEPPTFENRYLPTGREQMLHAVAAPIQFDTIPAAWRDVPIVHLGPILDETPATLVGAFPRALIGVTPQGWMREWDATFPTPVRYRPWHPPPKLLREIDALVLSIEDVRGDEALVQSYVQHCPLVVLTRGAAGATLWHCGVLHHIPALPAVERDPTGAGDVFAAALLVRLHETGDPLQAAVFAACVAAISVEGQGATRIPGRAEVAQRRVGEPQNRRTAEPERP